MRQWYCLEGMLLLLLLILAVVTVAVGQGVRRPHPAQDAYVGACVLILLPWWQHMHVMSMLFAAHRHAISHRETFLTP